MDVSISCVCRSASGPKLYFKSDDTPPPHRSPRSLRHHYLRHHRPRALLRQDAQNVQAQYDR